MVPPSDKGLAGDSEEKPAVNSAPAATAEQQFAELLAGVVGVDQISVDSHFFNDLGADSMVMARFCARVRKHPDLPSVSMKEVYGNPTIRSLAAAVSATAPAPTSSPVAPPTPAPDVTPRPAASQAQFVLCGILQFLSMFTYLFAMAFSLVEGFKIVNAAPTIGETLLRAIIVGGIQFLILCAMPILLKWLLVGRWKAGEIRLWSLAYVRFWFVKTLVQLNPVTAFVGTPIYTFYLQALGAKVGSHAVIFSMRVPPCSDLLTIGNRTVILKDAFFSCYRAHDGVIQMGPVTIGEDAFVGDMTVLDINTSMGDGAQLGHSSSLHPGMSIPAGECRCGSPAKQRSEVNYRAPEFARPSIFRKITYSIAEFIGVTFFMSPLVTLVVVLIDRLRHHPAIDEISTASLPAWHHLTDALTFSAVLFFGVIVIGFIYIITVPRLLNLCLKPDRLYRMYGCRYWAHRTIERLTNNAFYIRLFGDSSYVVNYLSLLGYDLRPVVQTGSNFGTNVKHISPFHVKVGSGTMVADAISVVNADYSSTGFRLSPVKIGAESFLGNQIAYSSQAKVGDNCLLGSKVMVPVDGEVREGIGLLGSPAFEIPRTVLRDTSLEVPEEEQRRALKSKNRHNIMTMIYFLLQNWLYTFLVILIMGAAAGAVYGVPFVGSELAIALTFVAATGTRMLYIGFFERLVTGFRPLEPHEVSIYDPYFWFHERYWKLSASPLELKIIAGTPLTGVMWRLLGAKVGKRVWDDGTHIVEGSMITVGDDCVFNDGGQLQPHSQEDGGFKSDRIKIGSRFTLGVGTWVHYGVTIGDDVHLAPDTFVMKGEDVPSNARWGENPAREIQVPQIENKIETQAALFPGAACGQPHSLKGGQAA